MGQLITEIAEEMGDHILLELEYVEGDQGELEVRGRFLNCLAVPGCLPEVNPQWKLRVFEVARVGCGTAERFFILRGLSWQSSRTREGEGAERRGYWSIWFSTNGGRSMRGPLLQASRACAQS